MLPALLFVAAAAISGFTVLRGGAPFDEGLVLQAGRRVADGQLPYRDFLWPYGPAQPYFLAGAFDALGTSLLSWRIPRVACDAAIATAVFLLVRRQSPLPVALLAWLTVAAAMSQPTSANPFPPALLAALLALLAVVRRQPGGRSAPVVAGLLVALAAGWRLDFGIYAGAAALAAVAGASTARRDRLRAGAALAATAVTATALAYLPFAVAVGPTGLYDALVGDSLRGREHWSLPFPLPWDGAIKDGLENAVPLLLVAGLGLAAAMCAVRLAREQRLSPLSAGALVLATGSLLYLLSRPDEFHTAPLIVSLALLIPATSAWAGRHPGGGLRAAAAALLAILALVAADAASHRVTALVRPPALATIDVAVADGAKAPPGEARAIEWMVDTVQRLVPPGGAIYAVTRRSDLVRFNQPLIYVLAQRRNPTDRDFGLLAQPAGQRRTIRALERARPQAIVRWTDPISVEREPNLRGEPSGSRALDRWLDRNYSLHGSRGYYEVLVPRGNRSAGRHTMPIDTPAGSDPPRAISAASARIGHSSSELTSPPVSS